MALLRPRQRLALRPGDPEAGFTLIELLVVMLILGVLAAIALPAFLNQRGKAGDAKAKAYAHSAQIAIESYATGNSGFENATEAKLKELEPTLNGAGTVAVTGPAGSGAPTTSGYQVSITSSTGNTFSVRNNAGTVTFPCTVASSNRGGCPGSGTAEGSWR